MKDDCTICTMFSSCVARIRAWVGFLCGVALDYQLMPTTKTWCRWCSDRANDPANIGRMDCTMTRNMVQMMVQHGAVMAQGGSDV